MVGPGPGVTPSCSASVLLPSAATAVLPYTWTGWVCCPRRPSFYWTTCGAMGQSPRRTSGAGRSLRWIQLPRGWVCRADRRSSWRPGTRRTAGCRAGAVAPITARTTTVAAGARRPQRCSEGSGPCDAVGRYDDCYERQFHCPAAGWPRTCHKFSRPLRSAAAPTKWRKLAAPPHQRRLQILKVTLSLKIKATEHTHSIRRCTSRAPSAVPSGGALTAALRPVPSEAGVRERTAVWGEALAGSATAGGGGWRRRRPSRRRWKRLPVDMR